MTRRRLALLIAAPLALVLAWYGGTRVLGSHATEPRDPAVSPRRADGRALAESLARGRLRGARLPFVAPPADGTVTISGTVVDADSFQPVGEVEVVFRSELGEETTTANPDGTYQIEVAAGVYRAFVRDDRVLSVGRNDRVRLPGEPTAELVNAPDDTLMPRVVATADVRGIELPVKRSGTLVGRVVDRDGRPVASAVVRAIDGRHGFRPALGSDVAETAADGRFELRLAAGMWELTAAHPRFAGPESEQFVRVTPGGSVDAELTLVAGCVITGRVLTAAGTPSTDGALEKQWGAGTLQFAAAGRIESDGTFRWTSTVEEAVTLRAWPWKSPPSPPRTFECKSGARHDNIVFQLPNTPPDIAGVLVDASGAPVPFAHVDLAPLTPGGIGQQERTDAEGKWAVYQMPAGRYAVQATAPGRGVATAEISSPEQAVELRLSGTGRIEGTASMLASGSLEIRMLSCMANGQSIAIAQDRRVVQVQGGRFVVDDAPACQLEVGVAWRDQLLTTELSVPANGTAQLEVAIGPPRPKRVSGVVRDARGNPVGYVRVSAVLHTNVALATTDEAGRYSVETFAGATLLATGADGLTGEGSVGMANVDRETVDLTVATPDDRDS